MRYINNIISDHYRTCNICVNLNKALIYNFISMRLEINIYNIDNNMLTYNYNESLRGVILEKLRAVNPELSKIYHDDPKHIFNFSQILGRSHSNKYGIHIKRGILFISSLENEFISNIIKSFLKNPLFEINNNGSTTRFATSNMRIIDNYNNKSNVKLITLSPIIIKLKDENKFLAINNESSDSDIDTWVNTLKYSIKSRYMYFTNDEINNLDIKIDKNDFKTKYIKIKNQRYLCSDGIIDISAEPKLIRFINDVGLGMKLKFGFGFMEESNK